MAPVAKRFTISFARLDLLERHGLVGVLDPEEPAQRHQLLALLVDEREYSLNVA